MIVVIDTNILVSGLWKPAGNASLLLTQILNGSLRLCYDYRIINEYKDVLNRPKFGFSPLLVSMLLDTIVYDGISVMPTPLYGIEMTDEDDRPFFEVAKFCNVPLVTGNLKHFPEDPLVFALSDFCKKHLLTK